MASAVKSINPNADVVRRGDAHLINTNAALGLQNVLKTNLGPKGTIKMYPFFNETGWLEELAISS